LYIGLGSKNGRKKLHDNEIQKHIFLAALQDVAFGMQDDTPKVCTKNVNNDNS
jgi:hypothetical protein